ncbi:MAG: SpvB/TcaC N-terminal domain-containing protein [Candidatus Omnitrophota bacterium]|nr:SpvB/TcaC N-terminal domain-containing protein [Candidatus Omnitrophota bacterium]
MKMRNYLINMVLVCAISAAFLNAFAWAGEEPVSETPAPVIEKAPATLEAQGAGVAAMSAGGGETLPAVSPSAIGGAFSSLMSESFKTDLATGAATLSIPIVVPPGRKNVQPNIALSYSSNNPNGICGVGWGLPVSAIQRSTKNGVPYYNNIKDTFLAGGEELVNIGGDEYRAKMESSFTKYTYISADNKWLVTDKSGTQYHFGSIPESPEDTMPRLSHPNKPASVLAWFIDKAVDVYGNTITYKYEKYDDTLYLKYIDYTSNPAALLSADKRIEFVYEDRPDDIYSNRAGWPQATKRRLKNIKISLSGQVIWTYSLIYEISTDTHRSLLKSIQLADGAGNTLPAKTFGYQHLEP